MIAQSEIAEKQRRVDEFLEAHGYDGLLLARSDDFAWFTCGGSSFVNLAAEAGVGALLIERDHRTVITNNVERGRLLQEEIDGAGFGEDVSPWYDDALDKAIARLASGKRIASDVPLTGVMACPSEIARLRWQLTPEEVKRYRALGKEVGAAIGEAAMAASPGMTEYEVAGILSQQCWARGVAPIVVLIAADGRIAKYRHPIPTANTVQKGLMLVVCGRRHGLIVSATRMVQFGAVPAELRRKHDAVVAVDTAFNANTIPGQRIGEVFKAGLAAYAAEGFAGEWKLHHQGGPTGYAAREYRATFDTADPVLPYQAFAWNPSITGTKSEDTIVATPTGPEIISASPRFPTIEVRVGGVTLARADILVR
jgi:antitoxin VapB